MQTARIKWVEDQQFVALTPSGHAVAAMLRQTAAVSFRYEILPFEK